MKIVRENIPRMTIEEFAERNALTMQVVERPLPEGNPDRFYAHFKSCEAMEGGMLRGTHGNGATEEDAISDYARRISFGTIVIGAMKKGRREIQVPRLITKAAAE